MLSSLFGLVFLAIYCMYAYRTFDKTRPMGWMILNVVWLAAFAAVYWFDGAVYFGMGLIAATVMSVYSLVVEKMPFDGQLVMGALMNVWSYPVSVFGKLYGMLKNKI